MALRTRYNDRGWLIGNRRRGPSHFILTDEVSVYMDGLLLSDGYIGLHGAGARYNQVITPPHVDWLQQIRADFDQFGIMSRIRPRPHDGYGPYNYKYSIDSFSYHEFKQIREKWYPDGKKIVPKDLVLAPITVMNWYLGDGQLGKQSFMNVKVGLSTQSFCEEDVGFLGNLLIDTIGLRKIRYDWVKGLVIIIQGRRDVEHFLSYANSGAPIPVSFLYKFDLS